MSIILLPVIFICTCTANCHIRIRFCVHTYPDLFSQNAVSAYPFVRCLILLTSVVKTFIAKCVSTHIPFLFVLFLRKMIIRCFYCCREEAPSKTYIYIASPNCAARGVAPVHQYHKCDESKILQHKRLGIDLLD